MIANRLIARWKFSHSIILIIALAASWGASPAALAASPFVQDAGESVSSGDGWQSTSGNPYRDAAPGEWTPSRNQLRETPPKQIATKPTQSSTQPASPLQALVSPVEPRAGEPPQNKTQLSNPNQTATPTSATTAATTATTTAPRWALPNQQQSPLAKTPTTAKPPTPSTAHNPAVREPRPFIPASNVMNMPPTAMSPAQQARTASPSAHRVASNNSTGAAQRQGSRTNSPAYVTSGSVARANATRNRQAAAKSGSYSSRLWQSVNVAFQAPTEWGASVEPEQLPLPGGGYHMDHENGSYMPGDGCSDGACNGGPACGCGGGCGEACGCGDGCGDGMCGCDAGSGCGGACEPGCGCEPSCGCGSCGSHDRCCDGVCIGVGDDQSCHTIRVRVPKWQELIIFGGVHGFKGPYDQDRDSGNFGFHEGINAGFKVPFTSFGYQIGYRAAHSQLNGDEAQDISDSHTQHFTTVGMFHRTRDGVQGGIAWDMLSDERFATQDFHQLRGELSLIDRGCHEIGAAVAFHLNEHEFFGDDVESPTTIFRATDQYLLFYRFHAANGGEGRFYGGWNDDSDGIIGSDLLIPLTDRWSLSAAFTYLIPEDGGGEAGASQEAWNIATALVWHWDCTARRSHSNCYRPLFNVADNGYLIIDDRPGREPVNESNGG